MPEGESGVRKGNLTEDRILLLAEYWRKTEKERKEMSPGEMGKLIGVSAATVRMAKTDKRVRNQIETYLNEQLLFDVIEARAVVRGIMLDEEAKNDDRMKAARLVETLAGNLAPHAIQVNNTVVQPTIYEEMSDADIKERMKTIAVEMLRGGKEVVEPPPDVGGEEDED